MTCTNMVPGEGSPTAEILFIGEAPGKNEDLQGRPFVGTAGRLLDKLLGTIGLTREDVFITNVLKARPPTNRDPLPDEAEHHWPWLEQQIAALDPKLFVLLGRHAMNRFLPNRKIARDHGQARLLDGQVYLPVYHPAAALYNRALEQTLIDDFAQIPILLERLSGMTHAELLARSAPRVREEELHPEAGQATAARTLRPDPAASETTDDSERAVATPSSGQAKLF